MALQAPDARQGRAECRRLARRHRSSCKTRLDLETRPPDVWHVTPKARGRPPLNAPARRPFIVPRD